MPSTPSLGRDVNNAPAGLTQAPQCAALSQMARVLVSVGKLVGPFHFAFNRGTTITKVFHRPDGEPELLAEIELYGDPVNSTVANFASECQCCFGDPISALRSAALDV